MLILIAIAGIIIQDWSSFWIGMAILATIALGTYAMHREQKIQEKKYYGRDRKRIEETKQMEGKN